MPLSVNDRSRSPSGIDNVTIKPITDAEFGRFRALIHKIAGISLNPSKNIMVSGRLTKRLLHHGLATYGDYFRLVESGEYPDEKQIMVDLLTTNETYFFREPAHFEFFRDELLANLQTDQARLWSAACSSGEEVYTLAMLMAEHWRKEWSILGSDVSHRMLDLASRGHYPMARTSGIPPGMMRKYCWRGVRSQANTLLIDKSLREKAQFRFLNLTETLPSIGRFHVIFLRNVLIYFDTETKRDVVQRVAAALEPGGYLFTSHTETLHGINAGLETLRPSIHRKC